ncbi:MAG: hypothetical protein AB7N91_29000 [Candidatus Tectimicrobiota bacterium]
MTQHLQMAQKKSAKNASRPAQTRRGKTDPRSLTSLATSTLPAEINDSIDEVELEFQVSIKRGDIGAILRYKGIKWGKIAGLCVAIAGTASALFKLL